MNRFTVRQIHRPSDEAGRKQAGEAAFRRRGTLQMNGIVRSDTLRRNKLSRTSSVQLLGCGATFDDNIHKIMRMNAIEQRSRRARKRASDPIRGLMLSRNAMWMRSMWRIYEHVYYYDDHTDAAACDRIALRSCDCFWAARAITLSRMLTFSPLR